MLAGRLYPRADQRHRFRMDDIPVPTPGPGQVLIKVAAAGVCLSDVHLIEGVLAPMYLENESVTLGHEVAGTVHALGPDVSGAVLGDRVLLQAGEIRDGKTYTRGVDYDGGWAEYALASVDTVVPIPDDLPFEQACFIPDAVSTPWAAITRTGRVAPAESAGVWGVGGLGAHGVQLLRLIGAAPVVAVDPLPAARQRALDFGADIALDPSDGELPKKLYVATDGKGLDVAFDFAGAAPVREQAVQCLADEGRLVLVGLTDKPITIANGTIFSFRQQQLRGHYGSEPDHVLELVKLRRNHRIDFARSVSAVVPLSDAEKAVHELENKEGNPIRIVLMP
ncbi:zinc-binding dehydrogenase [Nocardia sp. 2YAB30]|uniref:zinc-binding dehydrogenase n=1 Tax=unclassified Nocardia TaxID=2637762 RepID=UPI003F9BCAF3